MPHIKYYNYGKWEMKDYAQKKWETQEATAAKVGYGKVGNVALDELQHREDTAKHVKRR